MLENNEIDCAITVKLGFEMSKEFGWHLIREEPLTLVTPIEPTYATVEEYLTSFPIIRMYRASPTGRIADKYLVDRHLNPKDLFEIEAAEMILTLVSQGLGVSLLPDYGFRSSKERGIRKITITDRAYARPLGILYRRGLRESLTSLFHKALLNSAR
jgi:DNA-binding transcriptional LysR family regulator